MLSPSHPMPIQHVGRWKAAIAIGLSLAMHFAIAAYFQDNESEAHIGAAGPVPKTVQVTLRAAGNEAVPAAVIEPAAVMPQRRVIPRDTTPYYFASRELTQRPLVAMDLPADLVLTLPDVPPQAAVLRIYISEYGDIDRVEVEDSMLPAFAREAIADTMRKLRFHPGKLDDVAVKSQMRIQVMLENPPPADAPANAG